MSATAEAARAQGDLFMQRAADRANRDEPGLTDRAQDFVEQFLRVQGQSSSEAITNALKRAGLQPKDDRAFGAVYATLARRGVIEFVGHCVRVKGHGTSGGKVWRLSPTWRGLDASARG